METEKPKTGVIYIFQANQANFQALDNPIAAAIQLAVTKLGSLNKVAKKLGVDRTSLTRWAKGEAVPVDYNLMKLAALIEIPVGWLYPAEKDPK